MRERSIVWDVLIVGLLFVSVLTNGIILLQHNNIERLLLAQANAPRWNGPSQANENASHSAEIHTENPPIKSSSPSYFDESMLPKFARGDEKADDGDTLTVNFNSDPNSLNPLTSNDADVADFFDFTNEALAKHSFDDNKYWEPGLAHAWEKAMLCRALTVKKNAAELADKLNAALSAEEKTKLKIVKIDAESDEILRIALADPSGDYRAPVLKILGEGAILPQFWHYLTFEMGTFTDGKPIDAQGVAERARAYIQKANVKGRLLADWVRDGSVVLRVASAEDDVKQVLKAYVDSAENSADVVDQKSTSGKTRKKYLVYENLERYDFEEKPIFTFYIRRGVTYHDGTPFTGKDVVFSFATLKNPGVKCDSLRNYYQDCEKVELVNNDPFTVRYTWSKPYFMSFTQSCELPILPEHKYGFKNPKEFNDGPSNNIMMGTNQFVFEKWDKKQQITFTRNDRYWGHKAHFNRLVCKFVQDPTVSLQMVKVGDLDLDALTKSQAKQVIDEGTYKEKFNLEISPANQYAYVGYNCRMNLFSSPKTRQALTMLTDRKRICEVILKGFASTIDAPAHPDTPTYPAHPTIWPFDVEKAKKLLADDGWVLNPVDNVLYKTFEGKRVPFKFTLLIVSGSPDYVAIANQIKDSFAQAGIIVNVSNLEWTVFQQKIEQLEFEAMILGWRLTLEDDPYQIWHSSQTVEKGSNHVGYKNVTVDRLIEEGRRELNSEKRLEMFHKVYEIISEEQPYTFLFVIKRTVLYDKRLQNVVYKFNPPRDIARWWVSKAMQKHP